MADETPRLPGRAEELLNAFPMPERDYEADARAIDEKVAAVALGSTDAALLEAPFPADETLEAAAPASGSSTLDAAAPASGSSRLEAAGGGLSALDALVKTPSRPSTSGAAAPPSSRSLSDLARTVAQKPARRDSSDLYKESLSVAAAARAQSDGMIERVKGARPHNERPEPPTPAPERRRGSLTPFLAGAALALAAAAFLLLLRGGESEPTAPPRAVETGITAAPAAPGAAPAPAPREPEPAPLPSGMSPDALPLAPAKPAGVDPDKRVAARAPGAAAPGSPPAVVAARPGPDAPKLNEGVAATAGAAPAPAPATSALRPAAGAPGGLPDKPSTGAAQAALGRVMGPARACIAGGTSPVLATVVFAASGAVSQVIVRGPAASTPASACIQTALTQARVEPFASPSFSVGVTVRP